jgi:hypothetical protein
MHISIFICISTFTYTFFTSNSVKIVTLPLTQAQLESTTKMQKLTPLQKRIQERFADDEPTKNVRILYGCMYLCMDVWMYMFMYICMCVWMHICIYVRLQMYVYICINLYMHIYIYMQIQERFVDDEPTKNVRLIYCMHECMCIYTCVCKFRKDPQMMNQQKMYVSFIVCIYIWCLLIYIHDYICMFMYV